VGPPTLDPRCGNRLHPAGYAASMRSSPSRRTP
jgi:hypothetical protein